MRKSLLLIPIALIGLSGLTGCAVYPAPYAYGQPGYSYGAPSVSVYGGYGYRGGRGDRDGDGVPNRVDRRPNNPWRY